MGEGWRERAELSSESLLIHGDHVPTKSKEQTLECAFVAVRLSETGYFTFHRTVVINIGLPIELKTDSNEVFTLNHL